MEGLSGYDCWKSAEPPSALTFEEWDPITASDERSLAESEPGEPADEIPTPRQLFDVTRCTHIMQSYATGRPVRRTVLRGYWELCPDCADDFDTGHLTVQDLADERMAYDREVPF